MTVHCTSIKITTENIILNALINLELFNTLILNFAYIRSKRTKLGVFIFYEKSQFIYPNKVNSPIPSFSIFGHVACLYVTIIKR